MTFRHLEAFLEVATRRGFTKAAETLHLTQPTISGQIKELEDELGVALFHRLPRTVELTEAGALLLPGVRELLESRHRLLESAAQYRGLLWGTLELYASTIPGEYLLPPVLARFKALHPSIRILLRIRSSHEVLANVESGEAALGIVGEPPGEEGLRFETLWSDRIRLYASPLAGLAAHVRLEDLRAIPLIFREEGSGTRRAVERALAQGGLPFQELPVVAEFGSTSSVKEAVKAGLGAAFLSEIAVADELRSGLLHGVDVEGFAPIERQFHLACDPRRQLSPLATAFFSFLLDSL